MHKADLFRYVIDYFKESRPVAETELVYATPYNLIVAVILSAQCTDKRVNLITPGFFRRFPAVEDLAAAGEEEIFSLIRSCSYPNNKSKSLLGMARMLVAEYNGVLPDNIEALQRLPGVGRKTANVLVSVLFNQPALAVDTHVFRVAARIGLTTGARNPRQTEDQLIRYIPEELRAIAHHWLILHGRYICTARKPGCVKCGLTEVCKYFRAHSPTQVVDNSNR